MLQDQADYNVPYLILHKVRGEPAFDVAQRFNSNERDPVWIVSTSGHRAYPYNFWCLYDLMHEPNQCRPTDYAPSVPADWPDHYAVNDKKQEVLKQAIKKIEKLTAKFTDAELDAIIREINK